MRPGGIRKHYIVASRYVYHVYTASTGTRFPDDAVKVEAVSYQTAPILVCYRANDENFPSAAISGGRSLNLR